MLLLKANLRRSILSISETNYKVSKVPSDGLLNASRHIHMEIDNWIDCPYSSIRAYLYDDAPSWLNKTQITKVYGSAIKYLELLKD